MPQPAFTNEQISKAQTLVGQARANGGLAPVDLEKFWADQELARKDPFGANIPQVTLGIYMSGECVYDELGIPEDYWRYDHDEAWRLGLNKAYNAKAEKIVGKRLLAETRSNPDLQWPEFKAFNDIFEAKNEWHAGSWWLKQAASTEDELKALLDRVDSRLEHLRAFVLPEDWNAHKRRLIGMGARPPLYRNQRGPITFATSVYGSENLLFLLVDNPRLAARFRDTILRAMLEYGRVLDEAAGYTPDTAPSGFAFFDDNCCLLNPELYEMFGYPILKAVFDRYSPRQEDWRYQHSDSAMAHLLPLLGQLDLKAVNFGPTVSVAEIRQHMPHTIIDGQLAPFTFSRNEEENIVCEFLRDFEQAKATRGLRFSTAGSINNGSRLTGMRLIMSAIQNFGRY